MAKYLIMTQNGSGLWEDHYETARDAKDAFLKTVKTYGKKRIMDMWSPYTVDIILTPSFDSDGNFDPDAPGYDVFTAQMYFQFGEEGLDLFLEQ